MRAYQERERPLTIGELWAVAITLGIVLVENLERLAELIMHSSVAREEAKNSPISCWVRASIPPGRRQSLSPGAEGTTLADAFVVQLVHRLRDQDGITPALTWLDQHLAAQGTTERTTVVRRTLRGQGTGVTVRNIITGMHDDCRRMDWPELFERISLVDEVLGAGSAFRDMDFPARNLYRSAIEELSRGANRHGARRRSRCRRGSEAGGRTASDIEADRRADRITFSADGRRAFGATIGFRPPEVRGPDAVSQAQHRLRRHRSVCCRYPPRRTEWRCAQGLGAAWLSLMAFWAWCRPSTQRWRW